jgi:hypothetical protein
VNVFATIDEKNAEKITSSSLNSNDCSFLKKDFFMFVGWSGE